MSASASGVFARFAGIGGHLPPRAFDNDELAREFGFESSDEWVRRRTGIKSRHIAPRGALASDLALPAVRDALAQAQIAAAEIDLIVFATTTPDRVYPSSACLLQAKIGAAGCAAFDVQAVCSGFLYALGAADAMVRAGRARRALVVGAEVYSRILDWSDRGTCVLFGDGAGAAVLVADSRPGVMSVELFADGRGADKLTVAARIEGGALVGDPFTRMDGGAVYRFAVDSMTDAARRAAATAGIEIEKIAYVVAHQANIRIIEAVMKRLGLPMEKAATTVDRHGNTSAASIPLALCDAAATGKIARGDDILLVAVGGGFSWGAAAVRW